MEFGLFTEFQCPAGMTEAAAFEESMNQMVAAEDIGFDALWLGELHFQKDRSVLSSPLVVGAAIAMRTKRVKLVTAVQVLPLSHPIRLAEDVATLDHLSKGRLEFGIGRSGLPGHYQGFNIPYVESRDRFIETLDILKLAWTQERFSYDGKHFKFNDVCALPKPYQKPYPPIHMAASTKDTYELVGRMGVPMFVAPRTVPISSLKGLVPNYFEGWRAAGHAGMASVGVSVPLYVAETSKRAREDAEASTIQFFRMIAKGLSTADGASSQTTEAREGRAARLASITFEEAVEDQCLIGSPEEVADRLVAIREFIPYSSLACWMNPGGHIPHERVLNCMRLFAERVMPRIA